MGTITGVTGGFSTEKSAQQQQDLTGYPARDDVVKKILGQHALDLTKHGEELATELFDNNFMPYAEANWVYEGATCNCSLLSDAFRATWVYLKQTYHLQNELACANVTCCKDYLVTKPWAVLGGKAHGNVRLALTGGLDGRCLFPSHWMSQIGSRYFDPTFMRWTDDKHDVVECKLKKLYPAICRSLDGKVLYVKNSAQPAPHFSDSWNKMDATGWISAQDWKTKTAHVGHSRSKELDSVDKALEKFQEEGMTRFQNLKDAFRYWSQRNPHEAKARNRDNCVSGLASFLKISLRL